MKLSTQKILAAKVLKISPKRVKIDPARVEDLKEAITKSDIKGLIGDKAILRVQKKGVSRARANKILKQKSRGQKKGPGSRKGTPNARTPKKHMWMSKIRTQRNLLKELKDKKIINTQVHAELYKKAKGGFFRSKKHIKLYIEEHRLVQK